MKRAYLVFLFLCLTTFSLSQPHPLPVLASGTETVLYSFNTTDGAEPIAGLIFDAAGNLYGTTWEGGDYGYGTVFQLAPENGGWTEKVLHSFNDDGTDGYHPYAGLILDAVGNLYGTTVGGGAAGFGTVFQLKPGLWTETLLLSFNENGKGGYNPYSGLIFDAAGNLYGTTLSGGAHGRGIVFQLAPPGAKGKWKERVLHSFSSNDGGFPYAGLIFDAAGNLYGTTYGGGASGKAPFGTVFQLVLGTNGKSWTEKVLHRCNGNDGGYPDARVIFDAAGNLYGTSNGGGASGRACAYYGCGSVFQLAPPGTKGKWTETLLHGFNENGTDGYNPASGLIFDAAGNLYGTTIGGGDGGAAPGSGTVFQLSPVNGTWTETVVYSFCSVSGCTDGNSPYGSVIFDATGNLFGTTTGGGTYGNSGFGTVFEITP